MQSQQVQQIQDVTDEIPHIELWREYISSRSIDIRNKLIMEYSPLVKKIAVKTIGNYQYFNHMDDIINEGIIALMDAVEKFDLEKQVKFETFASIKIKGAMIDFIRRQDCFPRRIKKMARSIAEAESYLGGELGRSPTQAELANHLGVTLPELDKMQLEVYSLNVYSFEQIIYETNSENIMAKYLVGNKDAPEQLLAEKEVCRVLAEAIKGLKDTEQLVISLHYKEQLKIKDIATVLKISDSRVSQIHSNALKKLKVAMDKYHNQ